MPRFVLPPEMPPEERTPVDHDVIPTQLALPDQEEITYTTRLRNEGIDKGRELCQKDCPLRDDVHNAALKRGGVVGAVAVISGALVFEIIRFLIRTMNP